MSIESESVPPEKRRAYNPNSTDNRILGYLSHRGAEDLAERIRVYWAKKGRTVTVWVEKGRGGRHLGEYWSVRSDMHGGLPQ